MSEPVFTPDEVMSISDEEFLRMVPTRWDMAITSQTRDLSLGIHVSVRDLNFQLYLPFCIVLIGRCDHTHGHWHHLREGFRTRFTVIEAPATPKGEGTP